MEFSEKGVLITGGSSGIGLSAAIKFAREGAKVSILARNEEKLAKAVREIKSTVPGSDPLSISCDTRDEGGIQSAFALVQEKFGHLDIVVNNAGTGRSATVEDTSLELWREMLDVHCTGYFLVAREAVRTFIKQKSEGVMVFVVSDNSIRPSKNFVAYNTAKAGALHMARCIAEECGHYGIRVNSILPGSVFGRSTFWTPELREERAKMWGFDPNNLEEEYKKNTALNVVIEPDEVADLILFLASSKASKLTGDVVSIDGGGKGGYVR
jgi:NAD(P)-dependent dehydrogenase (short-subunit alcohol dehydrogenase family)